MAIPPSNNRPRGKRRRTRPSPSPSLTAAQVYGKKIKLKSSIAGKTKKSKKSSSIRPQQQQQQQQQQRMKNEYKSSSTSNRSVTQELQISCHTPADVLSNAGLKLLSSLSSSSPSPLEGKEKINHVMSMSSLILVRLSKLLISRDNARLHDRHHNNAGGDDDSVIWDGRNQDESMNKILQDVCCIFAESITLNALLLSNGEGEQEQQQQQRREENYWDAPVEGIKAAAVISRILYSNSNFNANKNDKIDTKTMMTAKDTFGPLAQSFQH
eukprot:14371433-Ditylum_brightwellii.AAC.1